MKKLAICFVTVLVVALLCAFCVSTMFQEEADTAETPAPSPVVLSDTQVQEEDLVGSWHLDSERNDFAMVTDVFPGYAEWDAAMEIGSDGSIYWYIGAIGGGGTVSFDGDTLTASLDEAILDETSGLQKGTVEFKAVPADDGRVALAMGYKDRTVIWCRGEAAESFSPAGNG